VVESSPSLFYQHPYHRARPFHPTTGGTGSTGGCTPKGLITYEVIQTAEGVILVSINVRAEVNEHDSRWCEVKGMKVSDDMHEYVLKNGDAVLFYGDKLQGQDLL